MCYHARCHFSWACTRPCNDANNRGAWVGIIIIVLQCWLQKQVSIKRFLKRNLADVGMAQWIHWLTKYTNKKCHACTQWYALHNMATLFNNYSYISSSGTSVGTKFTATYVAMLWSAYHHVHGTFLFVYFVSQCFHWANPTSARYIRAQTDMTKCITLLRIHAQGN